MAETTIRWRCTRHLVDLLRLHQALGGVQVESGWPGDEMSPETIWVDELAGDVTIPVMTGAARKQRDDRFTIPFQVRVVGLVDLDETMARLSVIVAAVEDVLAAEPTLADLDGVINAEVTSERLTSAAVNTLGHVGFAEVVVAVHARLI